VDDTAGRSDEQLLSAVASRGADALGELYDRYGGIALALAVRILGDRLLAEDVVQEAFLRLWRQAGTFQAHRGAVRPWLLSIVRHRAIDALRQRGSAKQESFDIAKHDLPGDDAWTDVYADLTHDQVRAALLELPAEQREAIELAYFCGLSQQDIADRLSLPLGTVKSRTRLGMRKLKTLLDDLHPLA
jgi:RNA polymerase sigma-70 factor (ECF subfamily)